MDTMQVCSNETLHPYETQPLQSYMHCLTLQ